ncbi:hypothetical protein J4E89_008153 [Alternaria sp. Ai002NY15]|nr:hypothetical protein J4E89_008153 [Alternaria sp. Ai002NY15]
MTSDAPTEAIQLDSFAECIEHCSRFWGPGEGCFGVLWVDPDNICYMKNSSATVDLLEPNPHRYTALIERSEMEGFDETCPHADLSTNTLPGVHGMQYTTHCGQMIKTNVADFDGYPHLENNYQWFYHADSLDECMQICVDQQPLCTAVSWNPSMVIGFANCILKTGDDSGYTDSLDVGAGIILFHSAVMTQIDQIDTKCPDRESYTAAAGTPDAKGFEVHCGRLNPGTNITSLHSQNITACMDACAEENVGCKAILFDSTLKGGFNNCYLQNTTSVISDQPGATYAVLLDAEIPSLSPSSSSSSSSGASKNSNDSSPSKAWIAGPVIGGLVALALIGFAAFWWRKRKATKLANGEKSPYNRESMYGAVPPQYVDAQHVDAQYVDAPDSDTVRSELPASTKYAHNHGPRSEPQEMPS